MDNDAAQFWPAFERANALLLSLVAQDFITERAHETARIASRRRQSSFAFTEGLRRAGAVLRKDIVSGEIGIADDASLFAAASAVAARQKIILKRIARSHNSQPRRIPGCESVLSPGLICDRSRWSTAWFRQHDNGPLVGFVSDPEGPARPVALLPNKSLGYEALDPEKGTRYRIGALGGTSVAAERLHALPRV